MFLTREGLWCWATSRDTYGPFQLISVLHDCSSLGWSPVNRDLEQCLCQATLHFVETRGTRTPAPLSMSTRVSSGWSLLLLHPSMATKIICCVALCLLGVGESTEMNNLHYFTFPILIPFIFLILIPNFVHFHRTQSCWSHSDTQAHGDREKGQGVTLSYEPISGHAYLYWYRKSLVQRLEFLIYFSIKASIDETGMSKDQFLAQMLNKSFFTLKIQPTKPEAQPFTIIVAV